MTNEKKFYDIDGRWEEKLRQMGNDTSVDTVDPRLAKSILDGE